MLTRLLARAVYYPTLWHNIVLGRWLKLRHWWDRVDPHCILGAVPLRGDPQCLSELGVTGVVNMCDEYAGPESEYQRLGIQQLWLPTIDFHHPSAEQVQRGAEFIQQHKQRGGQVYVHCKAGRARSATIVLWWLVKYGGLTPQQAQQQLQQARPHVNPRVFKRPVIQQLVRQLGQPTKGTN
ncbi:MAG: dual specificity protein phosphatase family protein [Pirellulaceae bacterium]|nr:dual specificity protein phosphatase family protein [Pirellulaceae bacterium]